LKHKSHTTSEQLLKQFGIALTGGIATGKSEVAKILRQKGFLVIDADELARLVVAPGQPALALVAAAFPGEGVIGKHGEFDRKAMRDLAFKDSKAREKLEAILHPAIREALSAKLEKEGIAQNPRIFFYEAALILEKGAEQDFREVWLTDCPPQTQLNRLKALRGIPEDQAVNMIASQLPAAAKKTRATRVIHTGASLADTVAAVESALAALQISL
jgi:dephospho-CoA kinase